MSELTACREKITQIDAEMAALFERRMRLSREVAAYKKENGLPVRDRKTESEKLARQKELVEEEALRPYYAQFLQSVMDISSAYQEALIRDTKADGA